jgi:hypothetical protein
MTARRRKNEAKKKIMNTRTSILGKLRCVVIPIGGAGLIYFLAKRYWRGGKSREGSFWVIVDPSLSNVNFWRVKNVRMDAAFPKCESKNWYQIWIAAYDQKTHVLINYCGKIYPVYELSLKVATRD